MTHHVQVDTSGSSRLSALDCFSLTVLTVQGRCSVSLPHHRITMTHCASTPLLLSLISVYVPDTHPASTSPSLTGAHRPFGVVLAGLEGERLPRVEELDVQDLPVIRAVGRKDARGANPELDQEVWLEGWGHPRVIQIWWRGHKMDEGGFCFFTFFIASKLYECSKNIQGHKDRKGLALEKTSFRLSCTVVKRGSFGKADEVCPTLWGECHAAIGHRFGMWKEFILPISFATKSSERRHLGCQGLWDAAVIHIRLIDLQLFSCGAKEIRFKANHTL